ncbi:MAG: hypothetical protein ACJAS4_003110 [Bacteriovoracaceae bacterium]|jgi:hypothetical protein
MKENKQIKIINSLVFMTGIFLICISVQHLFLKKSIYQSTGKGIGSISFFENDIRLKRTNHFEWLNIFSPNNKLNINDKIFSNNNSNATISLTTGHTIEVKEESLIKIKDSNSIKIQQGLAVITLKKGQKPLNIFLGKKKIQIKTNSNSTVSINRGVKTTIEVDQGELEVTTGLKTFKVQKNKPVFISSNEALVQTQLEFPKNQNLYSPKSTMDINFKFSPKLENSKILLSQNENFSDIKTLDGMGSHNLKAGTYYWRVRESIPNQFKIIQMVEAPLITNNKEREEILIYSDKAQLSVMIENPYHRTLLALYSAQHKLIKEVQTQKKVYVFNDLSPGEYVIKAKQNQKYLQSEWSKEYHYNITKLEETIGQALVIELKKPNQKVRFEWMKDPKDLSLFEVSSTPKFDKVIISKRIRSKNFTHIEFPVVGTFYWRTHKLAKDGTRVKQRPIKVIIRPTPAPTKPKSLPGLKLKMKFKNKQTTILDKLLNFFISSAFASETQFVELKFPKIENAKTYHIQIFKDKNSKHLVKEIKTTGNTLNWTPPQAGNYFWRISYTDHWGRQSPFSDSSPLNIVIEVVKKKIKPKLKPTKSLIPKVVKTQNHSTKEKLAKTKVQFLIGPSSMNYSQKLENKISIAGEVYDARKLSIIHEIDSRFFKKIFSSYFTQGGKVFKNQDYQHRKIEFGALSHFYNIAFLINLNQLTAYQIQNEQVENDKLIHELSLGCNYEKAFKVGKKHSFHANIGLSGLKNLNYSTGLSYEYNYKMKHKILLSTQYLNGQIDDNDFDINYQYFQLLAGFSTSL